MTAQTPTTAYEHLNNTVKSYADHELYEFAAGVIRMTHEEVCIALQQEKPPKDMPSNERLAFLQTVDNDLLMSAIRIVGDDIHRVLVMFP